jgi:ATP-dependent Clp protease protease subunit
LVNETTVNTLLATIDGKMKQGAKDFILLISSLGGSVYHGLTAYNYIRGVPANFTTHNFGQVDSVSAVLYCAGKKRLSVPQARFLLHGVNANLEKGQFPEKQLDEILKGIKIDNENIAKVIATTIGKSVEEITKAMFQGTTLNPEEARKWGFVHEVESELYEEGAEVIYIQ